MSRKNVKLKFMLLRCRSTKYGRMARTSITLEGSRRNFQVRSKPVCALMGNSPQTNSRRSLWRVSSDRIAWAVSSLITYSEVKTMMRIISMVAKNFMGAGSQRQGSSANPWHSSQLSGVSLKRSVVAKMKDKALTKMISSMKYDVHLAKLL